MSDTLPDCVVLPNMMTCNLTTSLLKNLKEATATLPRQNSKNDDLALGFSLLLPLKVHDKLLY